MKGITVTLAVSLMFFSAFSCCGGGGSSEESKENEDNGPVINVVEEVSDEPADRPGYWEEPERDDDWNRLFTSDGDEDTPPEYRSVKILESGLPGEVTDEIFVEYKTIRVYYSKRNDDGEMIDLIIEFVEPESSPYIDKVLLTDIAVYKCFSAGEELFYEGPIETGVTSTDDGDHRLTYSIEFDETYYGTATELILGMGYDLDEYGSGNIRAKLHIEP